MQKHQQLQVDKKVHEYDVEVESKSEEEPSVFGKIDLYQLKQEPDPNQLDLGLFFGHVLCKAIIPCRRYTEIKVKFKR